jgi:hypothetical protein
MAGKAKRAKSAGEATRKMERTGHKLEEQKNALRFEFIATELDLALTFCRTAEATQSASRSRRSIRHAEEAYGSAARFLQGSHLSEPMQQAIQSKIDELQRVLGEVRRRQGIAGG